LGSGVRTFMVKFYRISTCYEPRRHAGTRVLS